MSEPIQIDVLCDCSDCYNPPIFNEQQADLFQESGLFNINVEGLIHNGPKGQGMTVGDWLDLEESSSQVLFCIGFDQQDKGIDIARCPELFKKYKHLVYIVTEPIFSNGLKYTAKRDHLQFLADYENLTNQLPSIVLYSSKVDCKLSPVPNALYWTNLVDSFCNFKLKTEKKRQGVLAATFGEVDMSGHPVDSFNPNRWHCVMNICKTCSNLLDFKVDPHERDQDHTSNISYTELCNTVSDSLVQFQPCHKLYFHNLRFLQSWFAGTIPIVVNDDNWLEDLHVRECYQDWIKQHMKTCVLTDIQNFYKDMKLFLQDDNKILEMLVNISKLDLTEYTTSTMIQNIYNKLSKIL